MSRHYKNIFALFIQFTRPNNFFLFLSVVIRLRRYANVGSSSFPLTISTGRDRLHDKFSILAQFKDEFKTWININAKVISSLLCWAPSDLLTIAITKAKHVSALCRG